jgi:transposase
MVVSGTKAPAYNVQTAVDAEHALIVTHAVTVHAADNRQLQPMAEAAQKALNAERMNVVADAGYSNAEQAACCEAAGLLPHVPANRSGNSQGDGTLFDRRLFRYEPESDTYLCPAGKTLKRKQLSKKDKAIFYTASKADCGQCGMKSRCTQAPQRLVMRLLDEDALNRMHQRATPEAMRLRRSIVEHPFAALKYRIFGHPRLLLRGTRGAQTEIGLATMAYNLKRIFNLLGGLKLAQKLTLA